VIQPTVDGGEDTKVSAVKENAPTSVFVNSEPIREEQVQNAVKFLSHPKVRGSPVLYRRSFLERKGLTKEEIDEAFRRVPDPAPDVSATQPVVSNQDGQPKSLSNFAQQPATQVAQPTPRGKLSRFHWSHALMAVGFLAVSGAGTAVIFKVPNFTSQFWWTCLLQNSIIPRLKSWIRKVVFEEEDEEGPLKKKLAKPSIAEEAASAAKAAAAAAADVARVSQEMLVTKSEGRSILCSSSQKRCFEELINMLYAQVQEMKSMSIAIQKLEVGQRTNERIFVEERNDQRVSATSSRQPYANGKADTNLRSVRSLSPPASVEPSVAPHPKSYMEEINDAPPNPNQPVSNPRITPRPKPWEVSQSQNSSTNTEINNGSSYEFQDNQLSGDNEVAWWQQKNVRITEIESGNDQKFGSSNVLSNERPVQRSWVPPQPPPVVMPEAAAAIRQPKKPAYLKEQMTDDQLLARSQDVTDELQKITKISESGGNVEVNDESSELYPTEVQKEESGLFPEA
ncbi:hypothetical protein RD792_014838, partial [Penstemon davidsonii]